jgi:hypothetical protein
MIIGSTRKGEQKTPKRRNKLLTMGQKRKVRSLVDKTGRSRGTKPQQLRELGCRDKPVTATTNE